MTLNIAIAQCLNRPDPAENLAAILAGLAEAARGGASLVLFPEAALSGFQAKVTIANEDHLQQLLAPVIDHANAFGLCVVLPSILPPAVGERPVNGGVIIGADDSTCPLRFAKTGLTASEKGFFHQPMSGGQRLFNHKGKRIGIIICREIEDAPDSHFTPGAAELILWPGYWGWHAAEGWASTRADGSPFAGHAFQAAHGVPLVQASFAANHGQDSRKTGPDGRSMVISADGKLLFQAPSGPAPTLSLISVPIATSQRISQPPS